MSTPAAKRRRTDAASSALSKPFRSPMKTPPATTKTTAKSLVPNKLGPLQAAATALPGTVSKKSFSPPISSNTLNTDPDTAALIKVQRQLEKNLRELKEELDIAEQARRIEADSEKNNLGGSIDGELMQLIARWKVASRQAAEELFTGVRDRVNRMGGPKAWKEMQERQKEFRGGWDTEPPPQPDSDDGQDMEKRDLYAEYDIDPETANEREARGGNEILEDEGAEDEFTMAMMLRSLNVPLTTIGYDRENQRWAD